MTRTDAATTAAGWVQSSSVKVVSIGEPSGVLSPDEAGEVGARDPRRCRIAQGKGRLQAIWPCGHEPLVPEQCDSRC